MGKLVTCRARMFRLELIDIIKRYPGVTANDRVNLSLMPGEIHAVLGENGAGKSTLMKIVCGAVQPDAGDMRWNGRAVRMGNPREARRLGIAVVFQHFSLFDSLTVAQNVWLGLDPITSLDEVSREVTEVGGRYGLPIDPARPVHSLSVGERQQTEIMRALLVQPELLILDEPTSVLTPQAALQLFVALRQLAASGCSILYVSHKLDEIRALCHGATVLRGGRVVGRVDPRQETVRDLARLMIGSEPPRLERSDGAMGKTSLRVDHLSLPRHDDFGVSLDDVALSVREGQVVGIAGVSGNGQKELLAALSGEDTRVCPGSIRLFETEIMGTSPAERRELGLHFIPEERLGRAAVPSLSLAQNTLLTRREPLGSAGWLRMSTLYALTRRLIETFDVKAQNEHATAQSLSGGNLQKFIVAREVDARPQVLVVSQPTWGVDVGAAAQIRARLLALKARGSAVLVVSEELDELFEICDVLLVIASGRLSPPVDIRSATRELIGEWMSGLWPDAAHAGPPVTRGAGLA